MPRLGIQDLLPIDDDYRVDRDSFGFETVRMAKDEDAYRVRSIRATRRADSNPFDHSDALRLEELLDYERTGKVTPKSLASSLYMRRQRVRVCGHLWKLIDHAGLNRVSRFDLIPRGWAFTPESLYKADPSKLLNSLKADLYRCGAAEADGFLFLALHGEHEPEAGNFQLHCHGVATGGMIDVVDALRRRPKYRSGDGVRSRVVISRKPLSNLAYRLTYLLKSYWPCRRIGEVGEDAQIKRTRRPGRIPEPYHAQVLLWLDRWSLSGITLLVHLSVGKAGFQIGTPK